MTFKLKRRVQPINPTQAGPYDRGHYIYGWTVMGALWAREVVSQDEFIESPDSIFVSTTFYLTGTTPENLTVVPLE